MFERLNLYYIERPSSRPARLHEWKHAVVAAATPEDARKAHRECSSTGWIPLDEVVVTLVGEASLRVTAGIIYATVATAPASQNTGSPK